MNDSPMKIALEQAKQAAAQDEVPVGAVIVHHQTGMVIATACNQVEAKKDIVAHAELLAIQKASSHIDNKYLTDYDLYVTLEPCAMCAAAISAARIKRIYFGAYDPKSGGVDHGPRIFASSSCHHVPEVYGGIMEEECGHILREFFAAKR